MTGSTRSAGDGTDSTIESLGKGMNNSTLIELTEAWNFLQSSYTQSWAAVCRLLLFLAPPSWLGHFLAPSLRLDEFKPVFNGMPLTLEEGASASPIDLKLLEDKVQKGGPDSWQLEGGANAAWVNPFWVSHEVPCLILSRTEMMLKTDCSVPINFMACQVNLLPWNYKRALSSQLLLRKNAIHFLMGGRYMKPAGIEISVVVNSVSDLADLGKSVLKRVSPEEDHWSFLLSTYRDVRQEKHIEAPWLAFVLVKIFMVICTLSACQWNYCGSNKTVTGIIT